MTEVDGGGDIYVPAYWYSYNKRLLRNAVRDNLSYCQLKRAVSSMMNSVKMRLFFSAPNTRYPGVQETTQQPLRVLLPTVLLCFALLYSLAHALKHWYPRARARRIRTYEFSVPITSHTGRTVAPVRPVRLNCVYLSYGTNIPVRTRYVPVAN